MGSSKASIKRLQLSQFKLNSLLEITQAINENLSTLELVAKYEKILTDDLNIGKVIIYSHDGQKWKSILEAGVENLDIDPNIIVPEDLANYQAITNITTIDYGYLKPFDIIIPVYHKDTAVSYVLIGDIDEDREGISPTIKHLHFIQTITNIIVVAIENKRLYNESLKQEAFKKELELASKMQSMLIPNSSSLPQNGKINTAAYYSPHSEVGGDYYDFIKLSETEYGFCIADVSGKGISAAILMSNFQANLRALFTRKSNLKEIVLKLNDIVMANANGEKFITFFIGKYDTVTSKLSYINAGHNPPLLNSPKKNDIFYLTEGCIGLGMFEEIPHIKEGSIEICHGDKLICYTDGLVEAENPNQEEFGTIPLEGCISSHDNILATINTLIEQLHNFTQDETLGDDITILGIDFK